MSLLTERPARTTTNGTSRPQSTTPTLTSPVLGGALAALQAAAGGLAVVLVPAVLAWLTTTGVAATGWDALRVGAGFWLLAHRGGLAIGAARVGLMPLGLTAVAGALLWRAARRLGVTLAPRPGERRVLGPALASLVLTYAGVALLVALVARASFMRPVAWQACAGAAALAAVAGGAGLLRSSEVAQAWWRAAVGRVPVPARVARALVPAGAGAAALIGAGALLVAVTLAVHRDRVLALHAALDPGVLGGAMLTLGQVTLAPDLALWASAWLAGPGFTVGLGATVTPAASVLGALPAVPALGALPDPGPMPTIALLAMLVPVGVGAGIGVAVLRRARVAGLGRLEILFDALAASALAAAGLAAASWLASGPAGPGRLASVGPVPWQVGLALAGEFAVGAVLAVGCAGLPARRYQPLLPKLESLVRSSTRFWKS